MSTTVFLSVFRALSPPYLDAITPAGLDERPVHRRFRPHLPSVGGREGHAPAVEHDARCLLTAVRNVADDRQAAVGKVHPDLVGAAGERPGFHQGRPAAAGHYPEQG